MLRELRDPVSGLTHLVAAVAAAGGLAALLAAGWADPVHRISFLVYGITLVLMFSASAAYHLINIGPRSTAVFRRIDHSAIYFLIAGTYTPICLHFFSGFWRWGILAIIWTLAVVGVSVKIFVINIPRWANAGIYILMGWMSLIAINEMLRSMPVGALIWLFIGGLTFTLGAVIYITEKPDFFPNVFGFHEIWHIFVILGCLSHFIVIFQYIGLNP